VSEQMPEITEAEVRVLDELAEMRESDPEGYAAVLEDLTTGEVEASPDPEKAHAEWILETLSGARRQQEGPVIDLLNQAWASEAEADQQ